MNKARRATISKLIEKLEAEIQPMLEEVADAEQEAFDNMPESFEGTERYKESETACVFLSSAVESLADIIDALLEIA